MKNYLVYEANEELNSVIRDAMRNLSHHINGTPIVDCKKIMTKSFSEMEMVCKKYGVDITNIDMETYFGRAHMNAMKSISDKLTDHYILARRLTNAAADYLNAIFMKEV